MPGSARGRRIVLMAQMDRWATCTLISPSPWASSQIKPLGMSSAYYPPSMRCSMTVTARGGDDPEDRAA